MSKRQRDQLLRVITLVLIFVFVLGGVLASNNVQNGTTTTLPTATANGFTTPTVVFPTVQPGGSKVTSDFTYFHSSGLMSLPHVVGWDPNNQQGVSPEQRIEPAGTPYAVGAGTPTPSQSTIIGVTFINAQAFSVIHAFSEKDPTRKAQKFDDLDAYYTKDVLNLAWTNFSGGWTETNRKADNGTFVINFQLKLDDKTYLARQLSRFDQDWLMTLRLVVPDNNAGLLDQLQSAVWPKYALYPDSLVAPLDWDAVNDYASGYTIRFPADWRLVDGAPGAQYTVSGNLLTDTITLVTYAEPGKAVKSEDDARAWVKAAFANATVTTVQAVTNFGATGFAVAYTNPDADGNQRSEVVTLLNGANGTLYVANLESSAHGENLLDTTNSAVSPDLALVRQTFRVLSTDTLVATATPLPTQAPAPTMTFTAAPPTVAASATPLPAQSTAAATTAK